MRSKKNMQKMHFTHIRLIISRSPKERDEYINSQIQNVCTKSLLRIHSVQHYYRNASTEDTAQHDKVKSLKLIERMTNIVIIFVLSTNATCCILLDKNKNIYATFLIIFVGEAVFMFQKIILELTLIDNPIDLNCLYNKFP